MRALRSCDFCDGPAAGAYEVVPGDVPGVSSRRMVLCDDCRDRLATIVDPLLDAIPRDAGGPSGLSSDAKSTAPPESDPEPEPEPESEPESDQSPVPPSVSESTPEPEPAPTPEPTPTPAPEADAEPAATSSEPASEPSTVTSEPGSGPERLERPAGYRKVVRLVENRDAGIEQRDLEELATSAYGLSASEVAAVIEFALEQGTFEAADGGLRTT